MKEGMDIITYKSKDIKVHKHIVQVVGCGA
jgi:hypothetical protein